MALNSGICPIWGTQASFLQTPRDGEDVDSLRAGGRYFISSKAVAILKNWDESKKVPLTSWLVKQRMLGISCPEILSNILTELTERQPLSVHDRADALLRYLYAKSELIGTVVKVYKENNAAVPGTAMEILAWTASRQIFEVITLAEYCDGEGWIEHRETERTSTKDSVAHELMLRPPGYARLAKLDGINSGSKQAFVAMWFDESMIDAYDQGIRPAIEDAGYVAIRVDRKDHNNKIDDEIIAEIRRSRFLVADFTQGASGARGGVYYEAGFAHGLNIPVIFSCRSDMIDKMHFDTRQYNHIIWANFDELRERLTKRISATLGDGPLKKAE